MNTIPDDVILDTLARGEVPPQEPLTVLLAAWRAEIHTEPLRLDFDQQVLTDHQIRLADRPLSHRVLLYALAAWLIAIAALALYFLP